MPRKSHAVFNSRKVKWKDPRSLGPSIVYNCMSDTICEFKKNDGIAMSVTSFPDVPVTFAVMYGCTDATIKYVSQRLKSYKRTALHPLMLPMMFVELERTRLLDALQSETSILDQRILEMQTRLSTFTQTEAEKSDKTKAVKEAESSESTEMSESTEGIEMVATAGRVADRVKIKTNKETEENTENMLQKDCKATKNWLMVSKLKNGVQSLITILDAMATQSRQFSEDAEKTEAGTSPSPGNRGIYTSNTAQFQDRLTEMKIELNSEVQNCDSLLGGMSMATQMEWNFYTRRDAKANIIIAFASKRDSNQMRAISYMGMVFLPGTFLALTLESKTKTLFSMTFFNWIPDESHRMVSPWLGLYCGSAAVLTLLTWWFSRKYIAKGDEAAKTEFKQQLLRDDDANIFLV
ncbi:hypothetical protein PG999_012231 [Apiospora kogelbergensis]|uniref:Uncharacterized protein n=1 Tax=Apiospora kogelbergensis TaxID=1337665 RepID=A0AAW0QH09_9PEZI